MSIVFILLALLLGFPLMGNAATYYADPSGSGVASCVDATTNVCTLVRAEAVSTHGDTIIAACGIYDLVAASLTVDVNVKMLTALPNDDTCATIRSTHAAAPLQLNAANNVNSLYFGNFRVEPSGSSRAVVLGLTSGYNATVIMDGTTVWSGVNSAINDATTRGTTILQDIKVEGTIGVQGVITGIDANTAAVGSKQVYINHVSGSVTGAQATNNFSLIYQRNSVTPQDMYVYINRFNVDIDIPSALGTSAVGHGPRLLNITKGTSLRGVVENAIIENSVFSLSSPNGSASESYGISVSSVSATAVGHEPIIRNNVINANIISGRLIGIGDPSARSYVDSAQIYGNRVINTFYNGTATPHGISMIYVYGGEVYNNYVGGNAVAILNNLSQGSYIHDNVIEGAYYASLFAKGTGLGQPVIFDNNKVLIDNRYGALIGYKSCLAVATFTANAVNVKFTNNTCRIVNNASTAQFVHVDTGQQAFFSGNSYKAQNSMTTPFQYTTTNFSSIQSWRQARESNAIGG